MNPVLAFPAISREGDIPYLNSPPIQFSYTSVALLNLGIYRWDDTPSALTPNRPILDNALYYMRSVTLTADIEEMDFTANIDPNPVPALPPQTTGVPQFQLYSLSDSMAVIYREPLLMARFFDQFDYRLWWSSQQGNDQLLAGFRGQLVQGGGLIGRGAIRLSAIISCTEINDEGFIKMFRSAYPDLPEGLRGEAFNG